MSDDKNPVLSEYQRKQREFYEEVQSVEDGGKLPHWIVSNENDDTAYCPAHDKEMKVYEPGLSYDGMIYTIGGQFNLYRCIECVNEGNRERMSDLWIRETVNIFKDWFEGENPSGQFELLATTALDHGYYEQEGKPPGPVIDVDMVENISDEDLVRWPKDVETYRINKYGEVIPNEQD